MNIGKTLALLATLATVWGATYMHDRAHRYDIVAAGAGSGGSTDTTGDAKVFGYLIDHETGKVWVYDGVVGLATMRRNCRDMGWTDVEGGCAQPTQK